MFGAKPSKDKMRENIIITLKKNKKIKKKKKKKKAWFLLDEVDIPLSNLAIIKN